MEKNNNEDITPVSEMEPASAPADAGMQDTDTILSMVGIKLAQSNKLLKEAVGITIFISIVNILLGALITFVPSFAERAFAGYNGTALAIYGTVFMGMALGIHKRSRTCAVIALSVFALDTVLTVINTIRALFAAEGSVPIAGYAMKVVIFIGLIAGIRGCFQYHSLVNTYSSMMDNRPIEMIRRNKRNTKPVVLVLCGILAAVGVATSAYGLVQTAQVLTAGSSFENWQTYTTPDGTLSMKVPVEAVESSEKLSTADGVPVTYETAQSDGSKCSTLLLSYKGILATQEMKDLKAEWEENLLTSFITSGEMTLLQDITSVKMGGIDTLEASVELKEGLPGRIRMFSIESDIYMAIVIMNSEQDGDSELIDQYFNSITVNP